MSRLRPLATVPRILLASLFATADQAQAWVEGYGRAVRSLLISLLPAALLLRTTQEKVYNILWALVFAFATLNILSLGARHFESDRRGLTFGEILAIMVVVVSLVLLGWEMLYLFHVFPIRLAPH